MSEYTVGQASLLLVPSFKGFADSVDAQAAQWGDSAGAKFSDAFNARASSETSDAIGDQDADAAKKGDSAGGKFSDTFRARVDAALKSLPDIKIDADNSEVDEKLAFVRAELDSLSKKEIGVDITDDEALARLAFLKAALVEIGKSSESIQVKVDTGAAIAEIAGLETAVKAATDDGSSGTPGFFSSFGADATGAASSITGLLLPAVGFLATALVPLSGLAAGGLATLPAIFAGMASGLGAVALGSSGVSGAITALSAAVSNPNWTNIAAFETALGGLAPAAQLFVTSLQPLIKGFDDLKLVTQQNLFEGLDSALSGVQTLFTSISPFITMAAYDIGQFAASLVGVLTSKSSLSEMNTIFKAGAGFMQDLGDAVLNAVPAFIKIGAQATPILRAIGSGIQNLVAAFARWVQNGGFEKFMTWLKDNGPGIVKDISDFVSGFAHLLVALVPVGVFALKIIGWLGQLANVLGQGLTNDLKYLEDHWLSGWTDIHNIVNTVWHAIDNDVFQPLENFFTQTIPHALSVFSGAMTTSFQSVHDIINTIWHAIENDVIHPIVTFFTVTIPNAADGVGAAIQAALSDVESIIEAPFLAAWKVIDGIYNDIKNALSYISGGSGDAPGSGSGGSVPGQPAAGRASGGPVLPGLNYVVGEQGREILSMGATGGFVTNAGMSAPILSGLSGGSNAPLQQVQEQNFYSAVDLQQLDGQLSSMRRGLRL